MRLDDCVWLMRQRRRFRGLTVRQPWATAIALGRKTIEVRTWRTAWRGPVLIQAGRDRSALRRAAAADGASALALSKRGAAAHRRAAKAHPEVYPFGAAVAVARIADCRRLGPGDGPALDLPGWAGLWAEHGMAIEAELWGWVLADVARALPPHVPLRGRLGLWKPTADEMAVLALARWWAAG